MKTVLLPNRAGFITNYLVCGPKETEFTDSSGMHDDNQLRYEAYLRSILPRREPDPACLNICLGGQGPEGLGWRYYFSYGDWFVDYSTFYSTLTRVELSAAVCLKVKDERRVRAALWSYAAVTVWCNGEISGKIETPVYKPIQRTEMDLTLHRGENLLYVKLQNLGVRDTRTIFGIQLLEDLEDVEIVLPGNEAAERYEYADRWLSGIRKKGQKLVFPAPAPEGTSIRFMEQEQLFEGNDGDVKERELCGLQETELSSGLPHCVISCVIGSDALTRHFEAMEQIRPVYRKEISPDENRRLIYENIAAQKGAVRNGGLFAMSNILARKLLSMEWPEDEENIRKSLIPVRDHFDCSDFIVSALLRYLKYFPVSEALENEIKDTLISYRYWMDQDGSDGMCFWSENHALAFYSCMLLAGKRYPKEYFPAAGRTGEELAACGREKLEQWFDCVEQSGFEEFLSSGYMCVTFANLLNIVDFGGGELAAKASRTADRILRMLALHTFHGTVIAPMGRVYRGVLYPFTQSTQVLMNLFNPETPCVPDSKEGWLEFCARTSYQAPEDLPSLMDRECTTEYSTGNALIRLHKKKDYCLTSVQSGREDGSERWQNLTLQDGNGQSSHEYTRSLNERFHGTTCFEPGVYGYQQHLWYGAVDNDTFVFTSHPGGTCESSSMRPGYWYGNGVIPAVKQERSRIGIIYEIPESHPIHFTHLFFPTIRFETAEKRGSWLFGQKGNGYVGVWSSGVTEAFTDQLFDCEYRVYGDQMAYFAVCSSKEDAGSLEAFIDYCLKQEPEYDCEESVLSAAGGFSMKYEKKEDRTQYV